MWLMTTRPDSAGLERWVDCVLHTRPSTLHEASERHGVTMNGRGHSFQVGTWNTEIRCSSKTGPEIDHLQPLLLMGSKVPSKCLLLAV